MVKKILLLFLILLVVSSVQAQDNKKDIHAPNALPGTDPEMLSPDYWIALNPDADKVIMTPEEIVKFNEKNRARKVVFRDYYGKPDPLEGEFALTEMKGPVMNLLKPLEMPETIPGDSLKTRLEKNIEWLYSRDFYDGRNAIYSEDMKKQVVAKMNLNGIPKTITRKFGIVTLRADVRLYPTAVPGYSETKWEMDLFQSTALYQNNPVAILHSSDDGSYLYVESPVSRGWVSSDYIAFADKKEIAKFTEDKNFLMATAEKVPVYTDPEFKVFNRYLYFSEKEPLISKTSAAYIVNLPFRRQDGTLGAIKGYIRPGADVHEGYLPYTKRNMIVQLFKLLNQPYGWADQQNKRDCSGTQRVLLGCFGIMTGRHPSFILSSSDHQVYIDPNLTAEQKKAEVAKIEPVITLAGNSGHIVMYLGKTPDGREYFMHQAGWGYDEGGQYCIVNRVAINSVDLKWYGINSPNVFTTFRK